MSCACECVDIEDGSCHQCIDDDVPRRTLNNEPENVIEKVTIPTVDYHQKYAWKILCSSDPSFCNFE